MINMELTSTQLFGNVTNQALIEILGYKSNIVYLAPSPTTYFTGAIIQNAKEDEDITITSNSVLIDNISIKSVERLNFRLLFWKEDSFADFIGYVDLDLVQFGFQIGGSGVWYLNITDVLIPYVDSDSSTELHMSLMCMSAAGKSAGVGGQVTLQLGYRLRDI